MGTVISYPIPAFSNPPIQHMTQPSMFFIADITLGDTTLVETTAPHDYVLGQQVRLIVPKPYGTYQLNGLTGIVVEIPSSTEVKVDIFSYGMNAFISTTFVVPAQIVAIGDINSGAINNSGNNINSITVPGAFLVNN